MYKIVVKVGEITIYRSTSISYTTYITNEEKITYLFTRICVSSSNCTF